VRVSPATPHQVPVPSQEGLGPDEGASPPGSRQEPAEPGQDCSVRWPQRGAGDLAAQDGNLVAEHDDLDNRVLLPTA
jgi:hypothetical protein